MNYGFPTGNRPSALAHYLLEGQYPMPEDVFAADSGESDDVVVGIAAYQSGGLIAYVRRLAELTEQVTSQCDEECFATSVVLMAAAALEAILSDYVYMRHRQAFNKGFRRAGAAHKYRQIRELEDSRDGFSDETLGQEHPGAMEIWNDRIAISHSEADNARSRTYGARINKVGARKCVGTLESFVRALWGTEMPAWLRSGAGLEP